MPACRCRGRHNPLRGWPSALARKSMFAIQCAVLLCDLSIVLLGYVLAGGGYPIATPIAVMMMVCAFLSFLCHHTRQVQIGAALFTGLLFGALRLDTNADTFLEFTVNSKLVELGNNLVLFFAGLSCESEAFLTYWKAVSIVGTGYFVMATGLFALIGWGTVCCQNLLLHVLLCYVAYI